MITLIMLKKSVNVEADAVMFFDQSQNKVDSEKETKTVKSGLEIFLITKHWLRLCPNSIAHT